MYYKNGCTAVIVGHNHYYKYTLPLVESLWEHEPELPIVIVDNNSSPPYPWTDGAWTTWSDNRCVARAINIGMRQVKTQWALVLDNDVLCIGPFMNLLTSVFDDFRIYGAERKDWDVFNFLIGWCTFISQKIWFAVGEMDEEFIGWGYQEVDFCWRAEKRGFEQVQLDLPFEHIGHGSNEFVDHIEEWRERNQQRFLAKHGL